MPEETDPLLILIPEEEAPSGPLQTLEPPYKLEDFILDILHRSGVWDSYRVSDGIEFWRVVERDPCRVRITGRISEMSQADYPFWLDLERDKGQLEQVNWTLYFDFASAPMNPRRSAMVTEVIDVPEQVDWRVALMGAAVVQAATLVAESMSEVPVEPDEDTF